MAAGNFADAVALQLEKVRDKLELLYQTDDTLWKLIEDKTDTLDVSGRSTRIPMEILAGGKFIQGNPGGGDTGLGSGIQNAVGVLTPVYFYQSHVLTQESMVTTDSGEKAIESYFKQNMTRSMQQFFANMESLLNTDGSGTLDTVVSTATNKIVVNNANQFYDNQDIIVVAGPSIGGSVRGTVTILSVAANENALYLTGAVPGGTTAGDLLLVNGSANAAASSLLGIEYFDVASTTGNVLGLNRSDFPGKLSTPHVDGGGSALTILKARRMLNAIRTALGVNMADSQKVVFHMNLDQETAWENLGVIVTQNIYQQIKGDESEDMLKKSPPKSFAGRPLIASIHAKPGRIDGLALANWGKVQSLKPSLYNVGGQNLFTLYGASGSVATALTWVVNAGVNVYCANVRANTFCDNLTLPYTLGQ